MRTLVHIAVGAAAGFALGILGPIAMFAVMYLMDPEGMGKGGGTPFAIMTIVTAPLGAIAGAAWGYRRLHPQSSGREKRLERRFATFQQEFGGLSGEQQRAAIAQALPEWIDDYRAEMKPRWLIMGLLLLVGVSGTPIASLILVVYFIATLGIVARARSSIAKVRNRWGDEPMQQLGELPLTLRPLPPHP